MIPQYSFASAAGPLPAANQPSAFAPTNGTIANGTSNSALFGFGAPSAPTAMPDGSPFRTGAQPSLLAAAAPAAGAIDASPSRLKSWDPAPAGPANGASPLSGSQSRRSQRRTSPEREPELLQLLDDLNTSKSVLLHQSRRSIEAQRMQFRTDAAQRIVFGDQSAARALKSIEDERRDLELERQRLEQARVRYEIEASKLEEARHALEERERFLAAEAERQRARLVDEARAKAEDDARNAAVAASRAQDDARAAAEAQAAERQRQAAAAAAAAPVPTPAPPAAPSPAPAPVATAAPAAGRRVVMPECMTIIPRMKTEINPYFKAAAHRDFTKSVRKEVTVAVGQITNTITVIKNVFKKLDAVLARAQQQSPQQYAYALNQTAKSFARQAETEIGTAVHRAFAFAHVLVLLFWPHPELKDYVLARLYKKCPYLIPYYPGVPVNATPEERKAKLRIKPDEDVNLYLERMAGDAALLAAIAQTEPLIKAATNPVGIGWVWTYLARVVNMPPRQPTAVLVRTVLQIAGHALLTTYGRQAYKLLAVIAQDMLPKCPRSAVAECTRLQMLLEKPLERPEGKTPVNE
ncbi:Nuclear pore complex nucleoporin component [Allomyces arbusculus]|nr:Nuclear pore complex nucleoporin component [Allomyces arbusculus]